MVPQVATSSPVQVHRALFECAPLASLALRQSGSSWKVVDVNKSCRTLFPSTDFSTPLLELDAFVDEQTAGRVQAHIEGPSSHEPLPVNFAGRDWVLHIASTENAQLHSPVIGAQLIVQFVPVDSTALNTEREFRTALLELGELAYSTQDDADFFQKLLERAVSVVPGAQAGSVLLKHPDSNHFSFVAALGYDLKDLQRFDLDEMAFQHDPDPRAKIRHNLVDDEWSNEVREWFETIGRLNEIKVNVSAPGVSAGRATAFLSLDNFEDPDAFDESAIEMTTVLARLVSDLVRRRELEADLREEREAFRQLAFRDTLTALPNRRHLEGLIKSSLSNGRQNKTATCLFFIDVDDFKRVNDELGHSIGDDFLVEVGHRLQKASRSGDIVGRWGGDEFLILPRGVEQAEAALGYANRLLEDFLSTIWIEEKPLSAKLSIGIGWSQDSSITFDDLVELADQAMYDAKASGKRTTRLLGN